MSVFPTGYLAPVCYYQTLLRDSEPQIEQWESFPKQTLRNRCLIAGTNGVQTLSVPVRHAESKQFTKDVEISYQTKWQHQHWLALVSAYRHTPFFDYYADFFRPFYEQHYKYLLDFNMQLHRIVMHLLDEPDAVCLTSDWAGSTTLDLQFEGTNTPYYQIFADKHGFQNNLSIVDLLFNLGNEATIYLHNIQTL